MTAREHDMPDDLPVVLGDQRQTVLGCDGVPQGIDQVGHDRAMVAERPQVNIPHGQSVARKLFAKTHARRVEAPPAGSHTVLEPEGHAAGDRPVARRFADTVLALTFRQD